LAKKIHLSVKLSPIHGLGVFAKIPFKKGEVVLWWEDTKEISKAELAALPEEDQQFTDIQDGKTFLIGRPERYVNHSCDHNTIPGKLCEIADRDILAGEEITANYANYFLPRGPLSCQCGTANCRKVVQGKTP
jgi:SET domain-containing protein